MSVRRQIPYFQTPTLHVKDQSYSLEQLHTDAQKVITTLNPWTENKKTCIWVESRNDYKTLISYLALWDLGACVVPIDSPAGSIENLYQQIPPDLILCLDSTSPLISLDAALIFTWNEGFHLKKLKENPKRIFQSQYLHEACIAQLSSGSTGEHKIILIGQDAIIERAEQIKRELQLTSSDKTLCVVPITHSHGIDCLILPTLFAGAELYLYDHKTAFPHRILEWVQKFKISFFSSVPQIYNFFNEIASQKKFNLSSLRHAFCGSAALQAHTAADFYKNYHLCLRQGYGLAEIGVITLNLSNDIQRALSIGKVMKGIQWKLAADGELLVKSPALFLGYLENKKIHKKRFIQDFFETEDLLTEDAQGYLYLVGRKNDFINSMGLKFYPREIEDLLASISDLSEFCVTSAKDSLRGEIAIIHAVKKSESGNKNLIEEKIFHHLHNHLDEHKIPQKIIWHDSLPKSPLGKILKSKLGSP